MLEGTRTRFLENLECWKARFMRHASNVTNLDRETDVEFLSHGTSVSSRGWLPPFVERIPRIVARAWMDAVSTREDAFAPVFVDVGEFLGIIHSCWDEFIDHPCAM